MTGRRLAVPLALVAIAGGWLGALPPPQGPTGPRPDGLAAPVRGSLHVHTTRSDGTGSVDDVASAAAAAGLQFVILTDHGDGTRPPDAPSYQRGVLILDAVEISTTQGHVLAVGMSPSPYPLGGDPRDVLEDVARLGGFSIAAHPASEREELRWTDWQAHIGGMEWLNGDSEWRDEPAWSLARVLLTYPFRSHEALATLLDRPDALMARWDELTRERPIVAIAGADAHGGLSLFSSGEPHDRRASVRSPSYEAMFRTFSTSLAGVELSGAADADARAVLDAIRQGRVYSTIDALASPGALAFRATSGEVDAQPGDRIRLAGPIHVRVDVQGPPDARITLFRDGRPVERVGGGRLDYAADPVRAAYRVEVDVPRAPGTSPVPWIVSNPIYVGYAEDPRPASVSDVRPSAPTRGATSWYRDGPAAGWRVETSARAVGALDVVSAPGGGDQILFRFGLGGAPSDNPFVALIIPAAPDLPAHARLAFSGRASRPMRASLQLRVPSGTGRDERWQRSVFLDTSVRGIEIPLDGMRRRHDGARGRPPLAEVDSVMLVVDTVNTPIGSNGQIWIDDLRLLP